ncbi:MAG TPA: outer membrane protein assembly factor BamD [Candidatus Alistipes intestinipullorum]|nr:outer membrane protein assembly factor BamD [Candidatus Alistipes intestinipullorum]
MKQTFLYALCGMAAATLFAGCSGINALLKSGQPDLIYAKAMEYYQKEKWQRASTLFEGVEHYYVGTSREDSISFYNAYCKYKEHDWETASTLLDDFRRKFGRSAFIEDAEGMYALCFFYLAPGPTRDQTTTTQAIMAINEFMARYPNSSRIEQFKEINELLNERLHEKSYLNAYTYYKIGRYKSAIVALKNALREYPDSRHREEIMYLIVDAGYRYASNSIASKQTDRYLDMLDSYLSFKEEYPDSSHIKELDRMAKHARDYLDRNSKEDNDNNI